MRNVGRPWVASLAVLLVVGSSAQAFWWRGYFGSSRAYYSAAPVWMCAPAYGQGAMPALGIQVRPAPREQALASPRPAPPSMTEPPLGDATKRAPKITESRSQGGQYEANTTTAGRAHCQVGFWNLSDRAVSLKVNGQTHVLAKDRAVHLELERSFVWQIDRGEPRTERVPDGREKHEVMIR